MPRWTEHELEGHRVLSAPGRAERPGALGDAGARCPFCPGHEDDTPPEIARWPAEGAWTWRLVPNRYPAVTPEGQARGAHEVLVETERHEESPFDFSLQRLEAIVSVYQHRVREHFSLGREVVVCFKNSGARAGETLPHPHSQIVALDEMSSPPRAGTKNTPSGAVVAERAGMLLWCPTGSRLPYEMALAPVTTTPFCDTSARDVAQPLQSALRALRKVRGETAFNWFCVVHRHRPEWHLTIAPRVTSIAGFELATGLWINVVEANDAASHLRQALEETPKP